MASGLQASRQHVGEAVNAASNVPQAVWAVVHCVAGRHVGQQGLRRAHVGGGLVAANVLLTPLERHAQGWAVIRVVRNACGGKGEPAKRRLEVAYTWAASDRRDETNAAVAYQ